MAVAPLVIDVYTKAFQRVGRIGDPKFATIIPRHNAVGSSTIGLLATHRMVPRLFEDGSRVVIRDPEILAANGGVPRTDGGDVIMSGRVDDIRGSGELGTELIEVDILDDFTLFSEVLGWVIPTAAISAQGTAGTNWVMTGPAENVLKAAVTANATNRLGLPVTCGPSLGRGSTITAKLRFDPLSELWPVVDGSGLEASGIGVTVKQVGAGLRVDCYVPRTYARKLTPRSGEVVSWGYSVKRPTATRVVIGGQGEAQARVLRTKVDSAREATIGWKIERWRDARDVDAGADQDSNLYARGQETLDEGAQKVGLSLGLAETKAFQYGKNVRVGDRVTLQISDVFEYTDVLAEATLSWTSDAGWKRTPKVGNVADDTTVKLYSAVKKIARKLAKQGTRV